MRRNEAASVVHYERHDCSRPKGIKTPGVIWQCTDCGVIWETIRRDAGGQLANIGNYGPVGDEVVHDPHREQVLARLQGQYTQT